MTPLPHKKDTPKDIHMGVITISTTRSAEDDKSGRWMQNRLLKEGFPTVFYRVVKDIEQEIVDAVQAALNTPDLQALILTGGTGISDKDITIEAVRPLFDKELTAFGPLFAKLSYAEIKSAALMSRATAGISQKKAVFCIPGSLNACKLACNMLIIPEIGHIIKHIHKG